MLLRDVSEAMWTYNLGWDELIANRDLVTLSAVEEAGFFGSAWDGLRLWMNGFFEDDDETENEG